MEFASAFLLSIAVALTPLQDPEKLPHQEPTPEPHEYREPGRVPPKPRFPGADAFSLRFLAFRTRFHLETREFDIGKFSGSMDLADVGGIGRTAFGLEGMVDAGPVRFIVSALHENNKGTIDQAVTFEQHTFQPGTDVETLASWASAEVYGRFDLAGGPAETLQVTLLAGLDFSKLHVAMKDDRRTASEGFSALWPVPAIGLDSRFWLTPRLCFRTGVRGTHIRYENSVHLDGGSAQDVRFTSMRFDAGFQWDLSDSLSLEVGFRGLDALIEVSSVEDTDTLRIEAGGGHAGVSIKF